METYQEQPNPETLPYAPLAIGKHAQRGRPFSWITWVSFSLAVSATLLAFWLMEGERLYSEGGKEYFRENFPFLIVCSFCASGVTSAVVGFILDRSRWRSLLFAGLANAWLGMHYFRKEKRGVILVCLSGSHSSAHRAGIQ